MPTDPLFSGFWWAMSWSFTKTRTQEECLCLSSAGIILAWNEAWRFSLDTCLRMKTRVTAGCSIPLGTLRPHTQHLRHASYNLIKAIAVDAVSSDQGGQGYFLAKNLNDWTALETNLFQLFVCILRAWGHEEREALNYVKLWRKERHSMLQSYSS